MALRITRASQISEVGGTIMYTVPATETASIPGIRVNTIQATTVIVSHYIDLSGTTNSYTRILQAGDNLSDDTTYAMAENDYLKVEANSPGVTAYLFIDIP